MDDSLRQTGFQMVTAVLVRPYGVKPAKGAIRAASLDPLIAGFWVFLGSSCKGFRVIDRGFRVWFFSFTLSRSFDIPIAQDTW